MDRKIMGLAVVALLAVVGASMVYAASTHSFSPNTKTTPTTIVQAFDNLTAYKVQDSSGDIYSVTGLNLTLPSIPVGSVQTISGTMINSTAITVHFSNTVTTFTLTGGQTFGQAFTFQSGHSYQIDLTDTKSNHYRFLSYVS